MLPGSEGEVPIFGGAASPSLEHRLERRVESLGPGAMIGQADADRKPSEEPGRRRGGGARLVQILDDLLVQPVAGRSVEAASPEPQNRRCSISSRP